MNAIFLEYAGFRITILQAKSVRNDGFCALSIPLKVEIRV
jgi:hypothetical protein